MRVWLCLFGWVAWMVRSGVGGRTLIYIDCPFLVPRSRDFKYFLSILPLQSAPPCSGLGESQSRHCFNVPLPQDFVQTVKFLHVLHPPSTKWFKWGFAIFYILYKDLNFFNNLQIYPSVFFFFHVNMNTKVFIKSYRMNTQRLDHLCY